MDMLCTKNGQIVNAQGQPIRLRGVCVGGWMNMEHFIDGYPGDEHGQRAVMAQVLGPEKGRFFFDRLLDYFLAQEDIVFMKSCGATVARLPLNYRHFERDDKPFEYLETGFKRLDRVLQWCAELGLYAILDLHAAPGWQSSDWHCDNSSRHSFFWQQKQFQDRFVALWEEFARRYKGNPAVAGYNVLNEPLTNAPAGRFSNTYTPDWEVINRVYRRVVNAIQAIDADHLIFLEGDYFSTRFEKFDPPFASNLVYSSHNYSPSTSGPGPYPRDDWNRAKHVEVFLNHEGTKYCQKYNVPLWVGEFGAALNGPANEIPDRLRALDDQIDVFEEYGAHWTTWTYKDIGVMSWVAVKPDSAYLKATAPLQEIKRKLELDMFWTGWTPSTETQKLLFDLARHIEKGIGDPEIDPQANLQYLGQAVLAGYVSSLVQPAYAKCFKGMSETELDAVLQSFAFKNCTPSQAMLGVLKKHMARPA